MARTAPAPDPRITWPPDHVPSSAVVFAQNTVDISASPEAVWSLLIDCVRWPTWYRYCTDVSILRGGPLLSSGSKFRFKTLGFYGEPEITTFEPARMLVWSATGAAGLGGSHAWYIETTSYGCRVITEEVQTGRLLRLVSPLIRHRLLTMHGEWLRALKEGAEVLK